jgi:cytochrome c oxidase assembly factor CtaG
MRLHQTGAGIVRAFFEKREETLGNDLVCLLKEGFLWFKDSHPIVKVIVFLAIFSFYTFWLIYDSVITASITIGELILKHHIWIRVLSLVTTLLTLLILLY